MMCIFVKLLSKCPKYARSFKIICNYGLQCVPKLHFMTRFRQNFLILHAKWAWQVLGPPIKLLRDVDCVHDCSECPKKEWRLSTRLKQYVKMWHSAPRRRYHCRMQQHCIASPVHRSSPLTDTTATDTDRAWSTDWDHRLRWQQVGPATSAYRAATSPTSLARYTYVHVSFFSL